MHVVGDSQRQPSHHRHRSERFIRFLYDMVIVVKYITFLVLLATTTISAKRTFSVDFWNPKGFALSNVLEFKLTNCSYTTTREMYAFTNVTATFTSENSAELFTDFAGQLRTVIIIAAVSMFLGAINRELFRSNRFFLRYRHMYFHKDVVTTLEVLLLAYLFYAVFHVDQQSSLLKDYLSHCFVTRTTYLPHVSLTTMYVFIGCAAGSLIMALLLLMYNALGQNVRPVDQPMAEEDDEDADDGESISSGDEDEGPGGVVRGGRQDGEEMRESYIGRSHRHRHTAAVARGGSGGRGGRGGDAYDADPAELTSSATFGNFQESLSGSQYSKQYAAAAANNNTTRGAGGGGGARNRRSTAAPQSPSVSSRNGNVKPSSSAPAAVASAAAPPPPPPDSFYLYQQPGGAGSVNHH